MSILSSMVPRGVRRLLRLQPTRQRLIREMDDEVRFHFAMRVAELRALGLNELEAEAEARRRFGSTDEFQAYAAYRAARRSRRLRIGDWLDGWSQDLRFAGRQIARNRAVSTLAVLTLALGIGANTAIFTVVHRLLLAPLPYPDGNRLVLLAIQRGDRGRGSPNGAVVRAWQARARSLEAVAAVSVNALLVQDTLEQDTITATVTSNYLSLLGLRPAIGRDFTRAEERPGAPPVAMITYGLWQRHYGGRASVVGSRLGVDGKSYTIIGVTPPEMGIPMSLNGRGTLHQAAPSIWLTASLDSVGGDLFARLRPHVSAQQASAELQSILASVPATEARAGPFAQPARCCARALRAQDFLDPNESRAVQVLFAAVGLLLLIACANVANLLMSRAWTRRREFAVRVALGAGRARLARLVLTESVALAFAGGLLGVGIAWQTLRVIIALRPPALANLAGVHLETPVLLWSVAISLVTGILFGSAPALFAGARSVGDVLRNETRAGSGDTRSRRLRSVLVVGEIALSLVLLVGAGLLSRSFIALAHTPLGFEPHGLLSFDALLAPRALRGMSPEARFAIERSIIDRVRATAGVTDAAIGTMPAQAYHAFGASLAADPDATGQSRSAAYGIVFMTPSYFRTARMTLIAGRLPDSTLGGGFDGPGANAAEVVVNRELARQLWPDGRALGARVHSVSAHNSFGPPRRLISPAAPEAPSVVVGIVDDVRLPGAATEPTIYQWPVPVEVPLLARITGSNAAAVAAIRHAFADVAPFAIVQTVTVGDDYIRDALAPTRFALALLAAFSIIALVLSAVGLYGVVAYAVTQRTREFGIRVALGAEPRAIARLVLGDGARRVAAGVVIGALAAVAATRSLTNMLYGVTTTDPLTIAGVVSLVVVVALLASYLPARRAVRIDPMEALRAE
ncbi:MAG: ADOP family duplicated permease [Gemmatimonadales bacterium]